MEALVRSLGELILAPPYLLPTFGYNEDFARPEVRVDAAGYHFIIVERGQELQHAITLDLRELLLWIFKGVTFSMAGQYELENRIERQDCRILLFAKQVELLKQIDPVFAHQQEARLQKLLQKRPTDFDN
ncbi:Imm63 family immunity protein [Hymenobacter sublimis]|uniref:Immunity 63 family protein n=1 Tax=Hymenobacter sublimis TaxID=2933777 RepID=A0ABY4JDL8_9BACT|nr:Imm63 family immunity protein [Hymenobacter sublimis]UPL49877.1 immunity 63 family protein [Hymenobacter sublimis]